MVENIKLSSYQILDSFAGLERYLIMKDVRQDIVKNFIRLVKESEVEKGRLIFHSCHPHYTEPRLRQFSDIGLIWIRINEEKDHENTYVWGVTGRLDDRLLDTILLLKCR